MMLVIIIKLMPILVQLVSNVSNVRVRVCGSVCRPHSRRVVFGVQFERIVFGTHFIMELKSPMFENDIF